MEQQNITAVKGIGEKTAKLFQKIGVETVEELLHYYPRAYDEFKEPQPIAELKEDTIDRKGSHGSPHDAPDGTGISVGWSAGKVRIGGNQLCVGAHPFSGKPGRTDVFPETSCV